MTKSIEFGIKLAGIKFTITVIMAHCTLESLIKATVLNLLI